MHFSIPDTVDIIENEKTFTAYKVYINGVYHGSCRYSHFLKLHETLKEAFGPDTVPSFPPKKLFNLTPTQIKERRRHLEIFLQQIGSNLSMSNHSSITNFLTEVHKDLLKIKPEQVELNVFQMNGSKTTLTVGNTENTPKVLEKYGSAIGLKEEHVYYFGLFMLKKDKEGILYIVRQFQDFESPYLSIQEAPKAKIVCRKAIWDPQLEQDLMEDEVAVDLLMTQTTWDLDQNWIDIKDAKISSRLDRLRERGSKKEILQLCRGLNFYSYLHISSCFSDFPKPDTPVDIAIGATHIVLRIATKKGETEDKSFAISRIKTWRIQTVFNLTDQSIPTGDDGVNPMHELGIECLTEKSVLRWIKFQSQYSDRIILLSMCLQSIVDELIMKKTEGGRFKKPQDRRQGKQMIKSKSPNTPAEVPSETRNESFNDEIGDEDL